MAHTLDLQNPGDWLYDTAYCCHCATCGERYFGPKRSANCWEHLTEAFKEAWVISYQEPMNPPLDIPSGR